MSFDLFWTRKRGASSKASAESNAGSKRTPRAEEFARGAVERAVFAETVQHPLTMLPAAMSAVGALWLALISVDPAVFAVTFGSALVGAGAWIFNYFVRGEELARRHVEELRQRRLAETRDQGEDLFQKWLAAGHTEGAKQAKDLRDAYQRLSERLTGGQSLGGERLRVLAEDTYLEGVAILRQALRVHQALRGVDRDKLAEELERWTSQLERLGGEASGDARAAALAKRCEAHRRRLELYDRQSSVVGDLLAESEVLESALESTFLGTADLGDAEGFFARGGESAEALVRAVEAARRVEERLQGLNVDDNRDDEVYLEAGTRQGPGETRR